MHSNKNDLWRTEEIVAFIPIHRNFQQVTKGVRTILRCAMFPAPGTFINDISTSTAPCGTALSAMRSNKSFSANCANNSGDSKQCCAQKWGLCNVSRPQEVFKRHLHLHCSKILVVNFVKNTFNIFCYK